MEKQKKHSKSIKDVPSDILRSLSKKKIFFGHQSVGYNIMEGIEALMEENPEIKLKIVETAEPEMFENSIFAHTKIGKNKDPGSKTDAFVNLLDNGIGRKVDIAFHKYCYVDADETADIQKLFAHYKKQSQYLKQRYPDVTFIHVTMPLTTLQTGIKAWIKKLLGRPVGGGEANVKRNQFNALLKNEYQGKEPIFDLAEIEATRPDQIKETFTFDGREYLRLFKAYSSDGGHLNKIGGKIVAEQLILLIIENMKD